MNDYQRIICIFLTAFLSGCMQHYPAKQTNVRHVERAITHNQTTLDFWIKNKLSPYLIKKLSQHPRFNKRTIVLGALQGDNILPETDGLTKYIQDHIKDALLGAPNIHLAWQPSHERNQRLTELDCDGFDTKPIIIGIEHRSAELNHQTQVRVRALDPDENVWISGVSLKWEGMLGPKYTALIHQKQTGATLQGTRHYPFVRNQPDLVANYLAKNMSCLLRARQFGGDLKLNTQIDNASLDPFVFEVADHIDNYLTRFQEVNVTKDPSLANFTLQYKILEVKRNRGLYVLSVALLKDHKLYLRGMETSVYVNLPKTHSTPVVAHKTPIVQDSVPVVQQKVAQVKQQRARKKQQVHRQSRVQHKQHRKQKVHTQLTDKRFWQPQRTRKQSHQAAPEQPTVRNEFRGYDLETVEKRAFDYAMDYGPNKPKVTWHALAYQNRKPVIGYFKVLENVFRNGDQCRKYYEKIYSISSTVGYACRGDDGEWIAVN